MNRSQSAKQAITLLLIFLAAFAPLAKQASAGPSHHQSEADADGVTFDNLLAASSYSVYFEARNIGQQARLGGLSELIEPLAPVMGQLPKEIDLVARFIAANAGALSNSRLMIAAEPAKPWLPAMLAALELGSADEAREFQGKIQELLISVLSPAEISANDASKNSSARQQQDDLPFFIMRAGKLLAFSANPFTFKSLKRESDKPISDDPNFRAAHDRFYSETLFLYYDMALSGRVMKERTEGLQEEMQVPAENQRSLPKRTRKSPARTPPPPEPASPGTPLAVNQSLPRNEPPPPQRASASPVAESPAVKSPEPAAQPQPDKRLAGASSAPPSTADSLAVSSASTPTKSAQDAGAPGRRAGDSPKTNIAISAPPPPPIASDRQSRSGSSDQLGNFLQMMMTRGLSSAPSPDAIAVALTIENDSIILRALAVAPEQTSFGPIPFMSILAPGPAQASGAASYLPADTDIFIAASLDLPRLYDATLGIFKTYESAYSARAIKDKEPSFESKAAAFEKANGFKIRDQIAAAFGNEVAVGLPSSYLSRTPLGRMPQGARTTQSGPIVLISVRNKEALQSKLRPTLEALGLKSPNEKGLVEKRGDIEINSYAQISTAFIDDYLVFASDGATIRRILDARAKNETLATSRDFHSYMQWQPRETLAQGYISGAILKDLFKSAAGSDAGFDEDAKQLLARYSFEPEPISYLAAPDVLGPLYELRIPKKLLMRAFAQIAAEEMRTRLPRNELTARSLLQSFNRFEQTYKIDRGRYGELEELGSFKFGMDYMEKIGYKFELSVSGNAYEATATPIEYGKTGRLSFFIDQSGEIREGDHGGKRATVADKKSGASK